MAHILLATDLTPFADRALDRAVLLAGPAGRLDMVYTVSNELLSGAATAAALTEGRAALARYIADANLPAGLEVVTTVVAGEAGTAIVAAAHTSGCALVVLGAPYADLLVRLFRRSVVNHTVRHAPCPVLVVRGRARQDYRRVLVAIDLSLPARRALEFALRFLPGADISMVHARRYGSAATLPSDNTQMQLDDLATASLARLAAEGLPPPNSITNSIEFGAPAEMIVAAASRLAVDVAVVGTLGLTGASNLLLGSTAEALIDALACDVLAVRS